MSDSADYWGPKKAYTELKHDILEGYLKRWAAILGRPSRATGEARTLHYVDTHAGYGRHVDTEGSTGSPLIALDVLQGVCDYLEDKARAGLTVRCHFVERDPAAFQSLAREVAAVAHQHSSVQAATYKGDFQTQQSVFLSRIPADEAAFIFVDPFGYGDVAIRSVLSLVAGRRLHELFITFMSQYISRYLSDETKAEAFDRVGHRRVAKPRRQERRGSQGD